MYFEQTLIYSYVYMYLQVTINPNNCVVEIVYIKHNQCLDIHVTEEWARVDFSIFKIPLQKLNSSGCSLYSVVLL